MREIKFRAWHKGSEVMCKPLKLELAGMYDSDYIVMQFTGLKDKNGKEIYEGDILQLDYANKDRIVCEYVVYGNVSRFIMGEEEVVFTGGAEVIGNIYENPELLTEKQIKKEVE